MAGGEELVDYWLYPVEGHGEAATATLARVYSLVAPFTRQWVWQRAPFSLAVVQDSATSWHLHGSTDYGENVMDEWFVVALLQHVTRQIHSLVARVTDTDGEILCIEAASVLPLWAAEPSVAEGRVFLYKGCMHLLPVAQSPATISPLPAVTPPPAVAAQVVASYPSLSLASPRVQASLAARLSSLPGDTRENHHRANLSLPRAVAALLGREQGLLARVVRALQERDTLDTRAARAMARVRQEGMVPCRVTFSRCLYAMLSGADVRPYKGSGWAVGTDSAEQLGFKLCTGLEILLSRCRQGEGERGQEGQDFHKFLAKLRDVGFFQGELEGSRKHRDLMEDCRGFWEASRQSEDDGEAGENLLKVYKAALDKCEMVDNFLVGPPGEEESEAWLEVTPESLDKMLEAQFGVAAVRPGEGRDMPGQINDFLGKVSDMAGVEHEEADMDPDNLMANMKKMMAEMEGGDLGDFDSDSEDDSLGEEDPVMADYMGRLDGELSGGAVRGDAPSDEQGVDAAVMENLLKSYSAQGAMGGHGPASSLFQSLKLNPGRPE